MNLRVAPGTRSFPGSLAPGSGVTICVESQNLNPRPLPGRVLVRQVEPLQGRSGPPYIHLLTPEWPPIATVLAVGTGVKDVVVGDRVLFKRTPGTALVQDERIPDQEHWKNLIMLKAEDILGVVED